MNKLLLCLLLLLCCAACLKREEYALCGLDAIPVSVLAKADGDQLQLRLPPGDFVPVALDTLRRNKVERPFSAGTQ